MSQIDWDKFLRESGNSSKKGVQNAWAALKKKVFGGVMPTVGTEGSKAPKTPRKKNTDALTTADKVTPTKAEVKKDATKSKKSATTKAEHVTDKANEADIEEKPSEKTEAAKVADDGASKIGTVKEDAVMEDLNNFIHINGPPADEADASPKQAIPAVQPEHATNLNISPPATPTPATPAVDPEEVIEEPPTPTPAGSAAQVNAIKKVPSTTTVTTGTASPATEKKRARKTPAKKTKAGEIADGDADEAETGDEAEKSAKKPRKTPVKQAKVQEAKVAHDDVEMTNGATPPTPATVEKKKPGRKLKDPNAPPKPRGRPSADAKKAEKEAEEAAEAAEAAEKAKQAKDQELKKMADEANKVLSTGKKVTVGKPVVEAMM